MNLQRYVAEGEVLRDAVLSARDMCSMNFAREEFDKLVRILLPMVEPHLARETEGPASDIARHIEQIRIFSSNFLVHHRHLGASYGVVGSRPGVDVPEE
ncbi:hypothetical protein A7J50_0705 [Pseudomonas antarctica]|uniref:Uncharacterized protein n=1 Tax=Pseudomonas antarctica TaxID=219572 RepID=A0A172YWJ1_9PSED|nr:hypothetical protein [Pseudomonas antarctica]ANF84149.1 hypothetical protein A7J50_0705 [Pseudomonas antarctica]